jgi:hypothetical protein
MSKRHAKPEKSCNKEDLARIDLFGQGDDFMARKESRQEYTWRTLAEIHKRQINTIRYSRILDRLNS